MKKLCIAFCLMFFFNEAQTIIDCKQRFNQYLNFNGSLNSFVRFEEDKINFINAQGKKELVIYEEEIPILSQLFLKKDSKFLATLIKQKGLSKLSKIQLDSLAGLFIDKPSKADSQKGQPLKNYRIAIDPGHFATSLEEAYVEKKYLYFLPAGRPSNDSVKLFESFLTFNTSILIKLMLESQGATVFLSREKENYTSFNCTYSHWLMRHKKRSLDSLLSRGSISREKHKALLMAKEVDFFWNFFRDFDLANRASKINSFHPDITLIVHYNVDEKNAPWTKQTNKNFTMAFIGGAFTGDNLNKTEGKLNFLRMLLSDQLNQSAALAGETVANFNKYLTITIAKPSDAKYLKASCLKTTFNGVYCRNLALCRKINSVLVYGESLYQDNVNESYELMKSDIELFGIKTNDRLNRAAISYYEAVMKFISEKKQ